MIRPKVGDYIRILHDNACCTNEPAGTELKVLTVNGKNFTTESKSPLGWSWIFTCKAFDRGLIELIVSQNQSPSILHTPIPTGIFKATSANDYFDFSSFDAVSQKFGSTVVNEIIKQTTKCECGSDAVYGKNSGPEVHSSYCPKAKA